MARVEFTEKEVALLIHLLEYSLSELRGEIAHTDRRDFRLDLKEREEALGNILKRLESSSQEYS